MLPILRTRSRTGNIEKRNCAGTTIHKTPADKNEPDAAYAVHLVIISWDGQPVSGLPCRLSAWHSPKATGRTVHPLPYVISMWQPRSRISIGLEHIGLELRVHD